jgi:hypothetical protein
MFFLHDKLIPAVSMAFIFMCITTKNEMKSCEKEMPFLRKQAYQNITEGDIWTFLSELPLCKSIR